MQIKTTINHCLTFLPMNNIQAGEIDHSDYEDKNKHCSCREAGLGCLYPHSSAQLQLQGINDLFRLLSTCEVHTPAQAHT